VDASISREVKTAVSMRPDDVPSVSSRDSVDNESVDRLSAVVVISRDTGNVTDEENWGRKGSVEIESVGKIVVEGSFTVEGHSSEDSVAPKGDAIDELVFENQ
jgi:hypothetical protein